MKIIVFDTETTGLPEGHNPSIRETKKWPYIVQLSYILYDTEERKVLMYNDDIIRISESVKISEESSSLHGITMTTCKRKGISIHNALNNFNIMLKKADIVIGHNISFDKRMIMVESIRNKMSQYFTIDGVRKREFCTMKNTVDICKIEKISREGERYFKYPSLTELYSKLFNSVPKNIHNSLVDVIMCLRCYCLLFERFDVMETKCNFIKTLYKLTMKN